MHDKYNLTDMIDQLLDYDAARSKVRKLVDKPSEDATKLPKVGSNYRSSVHLLIRLNRTGSS